MKRIKLQILAVMMLSCCTLASCANNLPNAYDSTPSSGQIYLYGESHGVEEILARELELWGEYYKDKDMRHLFIEHPYYTAEFLNTWMKSDNDEILNELYNDWEGSLAQSYSVKEFYKQIKEKYPETIFHGTDIGHRNNSSGRKYISYLTDNNMKDSYDYAAAQEAIAQGDRFYKLGGERANSYREDKMAENFIREFDKLDGESVMGIYRAAHTYFDGITYTSSNHPCMANQLKGRYGNKIYTEDLTRIVLDINPLRIETLVVGKKEYKASYFGEEDVSSLSQEYIKLDFWRLENAYNDFADCPKTGNALPYDNYPMWIEIGQVFVVDYSRIDGSTTSMYFRSDGNKLDWRPATDQFLAQFLAK